MSRIMQAANFVAPHSGGIRTVLNDLADGYGRAGHEVITVIPGDQKRVEPTEAGIRIIVPGVPVPGTGYRVMRLAPLARLAEQLCPDVIEVHDRSTLRGMGPWARERGIPALVVSHERLDRLLRQWLPAPLVGQWLPDRSNAALAAAFDTVVCTTGWAAAEFTRLGVPNLVQIPLGVDLTRFRPSHADPQLRAQLAPPRTALIVLVSRLSHEKRPDLAIGAVDELVRRRHRVALAVAGDGPLVRRLRRRAAGLPATFLGHIGPDEVSRLLATADVALAPGPVETFGLAALEALASGTPVVANPSSALREVLGPAGLVAAQPTAAGFADAALELLHRSQSESATAARGRAELFDRATMVNRFLVAHGLAGDEARAA